MGTLVFGIPIELTKVKGSDRGGHPYLHLSPLSLHPPQTCMYLGQPAFNAFSIYKYHSIPSYTHPNFFICYPLLHNLTLKKKKDVFYSPPPPFIFLISSMQCPPSSQSPCQGWCKYATRKTFFFFVLYVNFLGVVIWKAAGTDLIFILFGVGYRNFEA